jgi:hypothetical protein
VSIEAEYVAAIGDPARGLAITGPIETLRITAPAFVPGALPGTWDHIYLVRRREDYGTHSLRRTKASIIYKATGNLRAVQILLETTKYCSQTRS